MTLLEKAILIKEDPNCNPLEWCPCKFGLKDDCEDGSGDCKKCWSKEYIPAEYPVNLGDDLSISQDVEIFKRAYEKYLKDEDPVNSPSHYNDGKIEVIDYIEDKKLGFCLGNAIKYISRAGKKDPEKEVEDLNKAIWYINRRIKEVREVE